MSTLSPSSFPERLRAAREKRDLSQADLATKADLQPSAISHFETGTRKPSFENLRKLADALSVSIDYLLGRDNSAALHGTVIQQVFRNAAKMSETDLELLANMSRLLAKRNEESDKEV